MEEKKESGKTILSVKNLKVVFDTEEGIVEAVNHVSFDVEEGKIIGIVGESGCGKSVTSYAIMDLIDKPPGAILEGEIIYKGEDLLKKSPKEMRSFRGKEIAMIFQEPNTALNPVKTIGYQIEEILKIHTTMDKVQRREKVISLLHEVGIPNPEDRVKSYPHEISGGQRQRVIIAIALACNPSLLIADEPTTALDVTIQAQILDLIVTLQKKHGSSVLLITHDLAVVAETAQEVIVMYAGMVVEQTDVFSLFKNPKHPYTKGLLQSIPVIGKTEKLKAIEGRVERLIDLKPGCLYAKRCPFVMDKCRTVTPALQSIDSGHKVRCHLFDEQKEVPP